MKNPTAWTLDESLWSATIFWQGCFCLPRFTLSQVPKIASNSSKLFLQDLPTGETWSLLENYCSYQVCASMKILWYAKLQSTKGVSCILNSKESLYMQLCNVKSFSMGRSDKQCQNKMGRSKKQCQTIWDISWYMGISNKQWYNYNTLPETNISPENWWLEDEIPFKMVPFQGLLLLVSGSVLNPMTPNLGLETKSMAVWLLGDALGHIPISSWCMVWHLGYCFGCLVGGPTWKRWKNLCWRPWPLHVRAFF